MSATIEPATERTAELTELVRDLIVRGVEFAVDDGKLRVRAADGVLTPDTLQLLRDHKEAVLRVLSSYRFEAPLSADQEGLWFIQNSEPDNFAYNVAILLHIESEDDHAPALRRALQKLVDRHVLLRTSYAVVDGIPRQVIQAHRAIELVEIDAAHQSTAEVMDAATAIHHRPFDLAVEGAFRGCLFRRGPRASLLMLCVHHIAIDGWSVYLLLDELIRLYEADGRPNPLPLIRSSYLQFVTWQRDTLAQRGEELRRAWLDELAGARLILELPTDRARPSAQTFRGATRRGTLAPGLVDRLRALARDQHTTLSTVMFTTLL